MLNITLEEAVNRVIVIYNKLYDIEHEIMALEDEVMPLCDFIKANLDKFSKMDYNNNVKG